MEIIHSCWFCDEVCDINIDTDSNDTYSGQVYCDNCGAKGPLMEGFINEDDAEFCAIEKWNNPLIDI